MIDFCVVSDGLLQSVLDARAKRLAELSTDHRLLACNLHLEKLPEGLNKRAGVNK